MLAHQCVTCWQCVAVIFSALCAIHGERVAEISSLRVFALCPRRSIFLAGGSEQPRPPTRPTRVHGSARSIFRGHPLHYRPKLNCPLQATLAMQCDGVVAGPHALPGFPSPRPTWELLLWYAIPFCALRHLWRARSAFPCLHHPYSAAGGPHARSHSGPLPFRRVQLRRVGEDV